MEVGFEKLLASSRRVNWQVEDIIGGDKALDFSKAFMPESFAQVTPLTFLDAGEQLALNHIRAHGYLAMFQLVETVILAFVMAQAKSEADAEPFRGPALCNFALEESKHMELFTVFRREFVRGFGLECGFIGPPEVIRNAILEHSPLSVAILVLGIEWMSQGHYTESVRNARELDPLFKSLLKHHWIEEVQHAQLDQILLAEIALKHDAIAIDRALGEYLEMGAYLDGGLKQQAALDLQSCERAIRRSLTELQRAQFLECQHRALQWTFLGSAMRNRNFLAGLERLGAGARSRVEVASRAFYQGGCWRNDLAETGTS